MSTPLFDPDDPRLTSYALGEADEEARRVVERWLAESAAARAEVEQTRALALAITAGYDAENARYFASRSNLAPSSNLVAFPPVKTRHWPQGTATLLKAAAALALTASLVYAGLRWSQRPAAKTVASAPPTVAPAALPPSPAAAGPLPAGAEHPDAPPSVAAASMAVPATPGPDRLLASDSDEESGGARQQTPLASLSERAAPAPATRRGTPGGLSKPLALAARSAAATLPNGPLPQSMVRVRRADGEFFGGVIVSPDGLILAAMALPGSTVRQSCTVLLPDRSELPAVAEPSPLGEGWCWTRIEAHGIPAAPLASSAAVDRTTLTVPTVNRTSGELTFSHVQPSGVDALEQRDKDGSDPFYPATGRATFAFDPAGALFVFRPPIPESLPSGKAKANPTAKSGSPTGPPTALERDVLRGAIEHAEGR